MSLKIDEYLSSCGTLSELYKQQTSASGISQKETAAQDMDSCILSADDSNEAVPCSNYNNILQMIQSAKAESSQSQTSSGSNGETDSSLAGAGGGSGSDSESEDETTTKVVVINGVRYLETTTVQDGVETVQRTVLSGQNQQNDSQTEEQNTTKENE